MALDWEAIRTEYVTTDTSLAKLAKKYGCTKTMVGYKSRDEGWVKQRKQYLDSVYTKTVEEAKKQDVKRLSKLMDATGKLIDVAMRAIEDDKQFNRFIVSEGLGEGVSETTEKQFEKVDTKALKDTVAVLKDLTAMVRDFYDIPTAAQREQREQARQKAEIEKKRAEKDEAGGNITIIVPRGAEDLDA